MGVLDSIFAGDEGIAALLHRELGGSAIIRVKSYSRNEITGELSETHVDHPVPFVPADENRDRTDLNAPGASRSDVKVPSDVVSGSYPCSALEVPPVAGRDSLILDGVEYAIQSYSVLRVGNSNVMYSVTAKRI